TDEGGHKASRFPEGTWLIGPYRCDLYRLVPALQRIPLVEVEDRFLFPVLEPVVPRDSPVVPVLRAVAPLPPIKPLGVEPKSVNDPPHGALGPQTEATHEINHFVSQVVGNPSGSQLWPSFFFSAKCSSDTKAMMESFLWSSPWSFSIVFLW